MIDAAFCVSVLTALENARPDATLAVLRPLLAERLGASQVRILLANYQLTALRPIQDADDRAALSDSPAGEAFVSQLPVADVGDPGETVLYLPVSIRGDRLGVLQLTLPGVPSPDYRENLGQLAVVVGYALQAAAGQADTMQRAARSQRLSVAAELQWQLLPGRGCRAPEYELAGHLEPAYHVRADNVDWSQDGDQLVLSVTDAAHRHGSASLLSTLAVTALRNARRAGVGLSDQACLADQAVYAHYQGAQYVSTLLLRIDLTTGGVTAVRAGSPQLFIVRGEDVLRVPLADQLPLGMFDGTDYVGERFELAHQDRLLLVSDGIHAASSSTNGSFGAERLPQLLQATAKESVGGVVRRVIDELFAHRDNAELDDDAAVICLDWTGPGSVDSEQAFVRAEGDVTTQATTKRQRLRLVPDGPDGPDGPDDEIPSKATRRTRSGTSKH